MSKTVIITGGSEGIGFATAKAFKGLGYEVLIAARTEKNLKWASKELEVKYFVCDVSNEAQVKELFNHCKREIGECDILINAAAIIENKNFEKSDLEKIFAVNVQGTYFSSKEAWSHMKGRGGVIINIGSLGGIQNTEKFQGFSAYTASKFAIHGLTESLAVEGKEFGIRVNAVAPGAVDTAMLKRAAPDLKTETKPKDIANSILYLCSDQASHITGTILTINSNE